MIIIMLVGIFTLTTKLYNLIRSDAGFNIGRNHMHDLGFNDDVINHKQDDADADMYVFRKKQDHQKKEDN